MMRLRAATLCLTASASDSGLARSPDADAAPGDLVLVRRSDAPRRRSDLPLAPACLAQQVELTVIRKNQMGLVADEQPATDIDPCLRELVDLGEKRLRVDYDTVADDAGDPFVQNPRRQQPQHEFAPVGVDGVTRVVPTLISRHDFEIWREQIDDLALPFVAPLRAEHRDVHRCSILPSTLAGRRANPRRAPLDPATLSLNP